MPSPFGFNAGDTPDSNIAEYSVKFYDVPKPHPDLKDYRGTWRPEVGLTSLTGISRIYEDDSTGLKVKFLYERLKNQLGKVYGKSSSGEYINKDATWGEEHEFLQSMIKRERVHFTEWSNSNGSNLDANIRELMLAIVPEDDERSKLLVRYRFQSWREEGPGEEVGMSSL